MSFSTAARWVGSVICSTTGRAVLSLPWANKDRSRVSVMEILRYTAFSADPAGGNPAGIVLDAGGLDAADMQRIAADVGFSETAFLTPTGPTTARVRYFAPIAEVAFCGHATIASAVARAERVGTGPLSLESAAGLIEVSTTMGPDGIVATLVSVPPVLTELDPGVRAELLTALRLTEDDLDPHLPIRVSYSGNHHPIVGVPPAVLDHLDHDQQALSRLMAAQGWGATVAVVTRTADTEFEARNPFPPGGVREDPATGSAAAALGGYLRGLGLVEPPVRVTVRQGRHVGRPGLLTVDIPSGDGGIAVSGRAVPIG
jgi:PhzF family phenazine biosynthesis protein